MATLANLSATAGRGGLTVEPGHVFQALKAPSANGNPGSNHRETAVYVYKVKAPCGRPADDWIRERSTGMSAHECMELARDITELGRGVSRAAATLDSSAGFRASASRLASQDVQRLIYWSFLTCFWNADFSENLNVLVNFDWYLPPHASRHTEEELREWCDDYSLSIWHLDVSDSGLSVLARREP